MKNLTAELTDFNRRMAELLAPTFPADVKPMQSTDGTLLFRGPIPGASDLHHVGTHVSVSLERDVVAALEAALPTAREEMIRNLLNNLGTQVQARYSPTKLGQSALEVAGTMAVIRG